MGYSHDLTGSVEGNVATPVAVRDCNAPPRQQLCGRKYVRAFALRPNVITGVCSSRSRTSPTLPACVARRACSAAQAGCVVDRAELGDGNHGEIVQSSHGVNG